MPAALAAGREAGVSRLAEVTRLDRLGMPVWQAVRPWSRALSVHQGKGATDDDARLGALLEAVESDAAERFEADGPICAFGALPERLRAPHIDDYAVDRERPPAATQATKWIEGADPVCGAPLLLPFDLVSLDFTRAIPSPFARSSAGLASGATREEAIGVALHELIERDAMAEWRAAGAMARISAEVDLDSIGFAWFVHWLGRLDDARVDMAIRHIPTVTGSPMFICALFDDSRPGIAYRAMRGFGCHCVPEFALFRALSEAMQARVTCIAGARDDLWLDHYRDAPNTAMASLLPPGQTGLDFASIASGPRGVAALTKALSAAGYDRCAVVDLAAPAGLAVVRAFACGLGHGRRRRRRSG